MQNKFHPKTFSLQILNKEAINLLQIPPQCSCKTNYLQSHCHYHLDQVSFQHLGNCHLHRLNHWHTSLREDLRIDQGSQQKKMH
uniref:Uncharacterized protein n=1 Tax=Manihot esculenta TaxID=3983 RepID=A0A2C9V7A7_MANES